MDKLTSSETRVLEMAREMGTPFTPTEIGMKLGYAQNRASSRVASQLRRLTELNMLAKTGTGKAVTYEITSA